MTAGTMADWAGTMADMAANPKCMLSECIVMHGDHGGQLTPSATIARSDRLERVVLCGQPVTGLSTPSVSIWRVAAPQALDSPEALSTRAGGGAAEPAAQPTTITIYYRI